MNATQSAILKYLAGKPPQTLEDIKADLHLDDVQTMEVARLMAVGKVTRHIDRRGIFRYEVRDAE